MKKYIVEVVKSLNNLFMANTTIVSVKRLRKLNDISAGNRSIINFYWRILEKLEEKEFINLVKSESSKRYRVPKSIDLKEVLKVII